MVLVAPTPAVAYVPPKPPLPTFLTQLLSGSGVYALPAGAAVGDGLILVQAGAGAYQGTCMALEGAAQVLGFEGECDAGSAVESIYNLLTTGSWQGRIPSYEGPASIVGHDAATWSPTSTTSPLRLFQTALPTPPTYQWRLIYRSNVNGYTANVVLPSNIWEWYQNLKTLVIPNANDPASAVDAYNLKVAIPGGAPVVGYEEVLTGSEKWVLVQSGLCSDHLAYGLMDGCYSQWTTGYGPAVPVTATFTQTCKSSTGTTFTTSGSVTYTPVPGMKSPDVTLPSCWDIEPGAVKTQVGVGVTTGTGQVIETATVPMVDPGIATKYPDCASAKCLLTPLYVPTNTRCFDGETASPSDDCVDYWPDRERNPSAWRCYWGTYRVPMSFCTDAYKPKFFTDGERPPTAPVDPVDPNRPCYNGCTRPSIPPGPGIPTEGEESCISDAFSLNPIDWVYVPVKCAFKWAFIPPPGTWEAAMDRITDPLDGAVGPWTDAIGDGWTSVNPGASGGCNGPGFSMPAVMTDAGMPSTFYPVKACSGAAATAAGYSRMLATAGLVVLTVVKTISLVQSGLGLSSGVPIYGKGQAA
ncbi:hypothetical protein [Nocardioides marmoriginsengisoli]|nr:hypothetical protein [Nocardioides marmoriginsengisoli]